MNMIRMLMKMMFIMMIDIGNHQQVMISDHITKAVAVAVVAILAVVIATTASAAAVWREEVSQSISRQSNGVTLVAL